MRLLFCVFVTGLFVSVSAYGQSANLFDWYNRRKRALDDEYQKTMAMLEKRNVHPDYRDLVSTQYGERLDLLERHYGQRQQVFGAPNRALREGADY